jgi:predicted nucleic acid-binding protein
MATPIAVIDTNIIILLVTTPGPGEKPETNVRRERVKVCLEWLRKERARIWVPSLVVTELIAGAGSEFVKKDIFGALSRTRNVPFDSNAADAAGAILSHSLKNRKPEESKTVMKFDALIAATAHAAEARWLLTDNATDLVKYLSAINSPVEVVDATDIPANGQLHLYHQAHLLKKKQIPGTSPPNSAPLPKATAPSGVAHSTPQPFVAPLPGTPPAASAASAKKAPNMH